MLQHHKEMGNVTVKSYMEASTDEIARHYAEFLLTRAVLSGIAVEILLLVGNRLERPALYTPFIWYSTLGLMVIVVEGIHNFVTAIGVLAGRFVFVPPPVRGRVSPSSTSPPSPLWLYLLWLVVRGRKFLQSAAQKPIAPTSFANRVFRPEEPPVVEEVGEQRV
ncbi:hypothetical protein M3Y99_00763600 [Aphelenchoides fujianensis]|nr:hypothetical protein M3Y99_00763600 [Aphelenchoides fujianensis]